MKNAVIGIVYKGNDVLVLKRRDVSMWVFPGGGVDKNESPEEAVVREILEETGLQVAINRKVAEYTPKNAMTALTHVYECRVLEGTPQATSETRSAGFYSVQKLPQPFFSLHMEWLEDAMLNQKELIRKPINQITYWRVVLYFFRHPIHVIRFLLSKLGMPINSNR
jgi:8-oxo-dGTP pyrophosphatase MutT (NUDIX family)